MPNVGIKKKGLDENFHDWYFGSHLVPPHAEDHRFEYDLVGDFIAVRNLYNRGIRAAMQNDLHIIPMRFTDLFTRTCDYVIWALNGVGKQVDECILAKTHKKTSGKKKNLTLEERVGYETAKIIRRNMQGTNYEWMLDLSALDWPEGTNPSIPVYSWRSSNGTSLLDSYKNIHIFNAELRVLFLNLI